MRLSCSLDPVIVQPSQSAEAKLMCCQFAFNASAVLTGDEDGCVTVYGLHGFEQHPDDQVTATAAMSSVTDTDVVVILTVLASEKKNISHRH